MIGIECIKKYKEIYPDDLCFYAEPGNQLIIENKSLQKTFISPQDENETAFLVRLRRCADDGHNYFYDEWEKYEENADVLY